MRRYAFVWLLAALLAAAPAWTQAAPKDDTLVIAYRADTPTMDPHIESSAVSNMRNRWVIQTLMHKTPEGKLVTLVAKSYKWIDPKTLEFEIRPGIKFSNGEELDAHAVKYSIERVNDPELKSRQVDRMRVVAHKDAVQVVDKYRVRVHLAFPDAGFVNRMGNVGGLVAPKFYASKEPRFLASNQLGSGPYLLKKWERDTLAEYEANPLFWDPQYPKVRRVMVKIIPEEAARVAALVKGEVDVVFDVPPAMFDRINQSGKARVVSKPGIRIFRLGFFNKHGGLFDDKRVRMSVAHAIDRKTLLNSVLKGAAGEASHVLHPFK
ncbi:MAG: ABC transporter substrate-binding protein, partial [Nitrospinota bacterium]